MSTGTSAWAPQTAGGAPQAAPPPQPGPSQPPPPYGWTPPPQGGAPVPAQHAPVRPPRLWLWVLVTAIAMVVAVAATAAITYAIARSAPSSQSAAPAPATPSFTSAEQADAKQAVCNAFDLTTAGQQPQGGVVIDGQPNVPVLLRKVTGAVTIVQALVPATPEDVATPARQYVAANLNLMNTALGQGSLDEIKKLTASTNDATSTLASACGLPG